MQFIYSSGQQKDSVYASLLEQYAIYQQLTEKLRQRLPENIAQHCRVVCVQDESLIIYANNNIVVNRLRMLLPAILSDWAEIPSNIRKHKVLLAPNNQPLQTPNTLTLSEMARQSLSQTAEKLTHHPELAMALQRLSSVRREK